MIVPEQASNQGDLADYQPCSSIDIDFHETSLRGAETFMGSFTRGGWRPILLKPLEAKAFIIDWVCPACKRPIYMVNSGRMICNLCGLHVKEYPVRKDPLPNGKLIWQYRRWMDQVLCPEEDEDKDAKRIPRNLDGDEGKHSSSALCRTSPSSIRR